MTTKSKEGVVLVGTTTGTSVGKSTPWDDLLPGRLEVVLKKGVTIEQWKNEPQISSKLNTAADWHIRAQHDAAVSSRLSVTFDESDRASVQAQLAQLPSVATVQPVIAVHATQTSNDPYFPLKDDLYNASNDADIDANLAWFTTEGSSSVTVAVIDTGVDLDHPDLATNIVSGYDFVNGDTAAADDHGHGTHVAGIIAAVGNNATGTIGVAPGVKIMPLKVLNSSGNGSSDDINAAIDFAITNGAQVINMSLSSCNYSSVFDSAIADAWDAGITVVAAAGNSGAPCGHPPRELLDPSLNPATDCVSPACNDEIHLGGGRDYDNAVVGVAAVDSSDVLASFSNFGAATETYPHFAGVDVAAPGVSIRSTYPNDTYADDSGTSMAAPQVAGIAALLRSAQPSLSVGAVRDHLRQYIDNVSALQDVGKEDTLGQGRANAMAVLNEGHLTPLAGANRYQTAVLASQAQFPQDDSADAVVVVSGEFFPDALSAAAYAHHVNGPILLTRQASIDSATLNEISRVTSGSSTVYIIGGTAVVSDAVRNAIVANGNSTVTRIAGADRIATAIAVATALAPANPMSFFVANSQNFPDGLSASSPSAKLGNPILLTNQDALDARIESYLSGHTIDTVYIVGGTAMVSTAIEEALKASYGNDHVIRLAGADRYATSQAVADYFYTGLSAPRNLTFAAGESFPDALVAGPLSAFLEAPLLLVQKETLPSAITSYIDSVAGSVVDALLLGGTAVVSNATRSTIKSEL